jgi:XisH protein
LYADVLQESEPDRRLYLAITAEILDDIFQEPIGLLLLKRDWLRLFLFEPEQGVTIQWIPS